MKLKHLQLIVILLLLVLIILLRNKNNIGYEYLTQKKPVKKVVNKPIKNVVKKPVNKVVKKPVKKVVKKTNDLSAFYMPPTQPPAEPPTQPPAEPPTQPPESPNEINQSLNKIIKIYDYYDRDEIELDIEKYVNVRYNLKIVNISTQTISSVTFELDDENLDSQWYLINCNLYDSFGLITKQEKIQQITINVNIRPNDCILIGGRNPISNTSNFKIISIKF